MITKAGRQWLMDNMHLADLVAELERLGFECEAGPLQGSMAFEQLKKRAQATLYEDMQALQARFLRDFGLHVTMCVSIHSGSNEHLSGYPSQHAVDLACKGGIPAYPEYLEHRSTRWFSLEQEGDDLQVILFY